MEQLAKYGWTDIWDERWRTLADAGIVPARVVADFGTSLKIATPEIIAAELSGKLAHYTHSEDAPKVGDWVAARLSDTGKAVIETVVPRRSEIARKVAGKQTVKQIIAANIDIAFVLLALDNDFSVERLKRFLYQLSVNHIEAVIVLNKADKIDDLSPYLTKLDHLGLPIIIASATKGSGVDEVMSHIKPGKTAILLGSSGVGKSTLTNQLLGRNVQATKAVRVSDETGQHTTVHRELFVLPNGGLLIDTPGVRELQLWGTEEALDDNFDDVAELVRRCAYANCRHNGEQGCAIQAALRSGALHPAHYASYVKMKAELGDLGKKKLAKTRSANRKSHKNLNRQARDMQDDNW